MIAALYEKPTLIGIFALILFSFGTVAVVLTGNATGLQLSFLSLTGGAIGLACALLLKGQNIVRDFRQPVSIYVYIMFGIGVYSVFLNIAFKTAPSFEINTLNYTWPILIAVFSLIKARSKPTWYETIGMLAGFIGIILLFIPENGTAFSTLSLGHVLAFGAALSWAFYSVSISGKKYPTAALMPPMFLTGMISLALHLFLEDADFSFSIIAWAAIAFLIFIRTANVFWDYAMKHGNAKLVNSLSNFIPLLSTCYFIALGWVPAQLTTGLAALLIVSGCLIVNLEKILAIKRHLKRQKNDPL